MYPNRQPDPNHPFHNQPGPWQPPKSGPATTSPYKVVGVLMVILGFILPGIAIFAIAGSGHPEDIGTMAAFLVAGSVFTVGGVITMAISDRP